jgi:hypothetical protein
MKPLALAVFVLLVLAPGAQAKGIVDGRICGPASCVEALTQETFLAFEGGTPAARPRSRAPFFELRYARMGHHSEETAKFVPSAGLVGRADGTWVRPPARAADTLRRMATGVAPYPPALLDRSPGAVGPEPLAEPGPMDLRAPEAAGDGGPPLLAVGGAVLLVLLAGWAARRRGNLRAPGGVPGP